MNQKCQSDLLDELYLAAPCSIAWDTMVGDDRKRLCNGCSRNVYNISDMTRNEAQEFLAENGTSKCMIFYRRTDGTIMTDNCPVGLRKLRDRAKLLWRTAASIIAFVLSWSACLAQSKSAPDKAHETAGRMLKQSGTPPPGFTHNPAGGGFIPATLAPGQLPMNIPVKVPVKPVRSVHLPPIKGVVGTPVPLKPSPKAQPVSGQTNQPGNRLIDTTAVDSFKKGSRPLYKPVAWPSAEFHFEKALDAFDRQKAGDAKFRKLIETKLEESRKNKK